MNNRIVFDDDFYRISAVLLSKKYLDLDSRLRREYDKLGLPVPEKGFKTETQYREWRDKAMKLDKKPGLFMEEILSAFNLDTKNELFRNYLSNKLFFRKMPWENSIFPHSNVTLTTRNSGKDRGLWVEIKPWTKKEDYVALWETISQLQHSLIGYRHKEKLRKKFSRDFEVYTLYTETKQKFWPLGKPEFEEVLDKMADTDKYHLLSEQFKDKKGSSDVQMKQIVKDFDELLKDISIF